MIAAVEDVMVRTREEFDRLPHEGLWEVVEGRAILLPANDHEHQRVCRTLLIGLDTGLRTLGYGEVVATVNVFIPVRHPHWGEVQNRVPDLVVSKKRPAKNFEAGDPPDLVIEVLSTPRGNVERTEKIDDYARAGIGEYWIVNPFDRAVEVYRLRGGDYVLVETTTDGPLRPAAFPGLELDLKPVWAVLD
jgi:Uma2 family endonuclease